MSTSLFQIAKSAEQEYDDEQNNVTTKQITEEATKICTFKLVAVRIIYSLKKKKYGSIRSFSCIYVPILQKFDDLAD